MFLLAILRFFTRPYIGAGPEAGITEKMFSHGHEIDMLSCKRKLFTVTVRLFKVGKLDNLTTWRLLGSAGEALSALTLEYLQINKARDL